MSAPFAVTYVEESKRLLEELDPVAIESVAEGLAAVRARGGRLFILGVGGSAGHASHAVNDFRKLCGFEAYAPTDNVSELTARTNDEGFETVFEEWLKGSRLDGDDGLLVFSVGGGDAEAGVSANLVRALDLASERGASSFGIVGRDGGHTARTATACVVVPPLYPDRITPHTEGLAAVVWHLLVSHPVLQVNPTKWESVAGGREVMTARARVVIVGGAGFIGSHFTDALLADEGTERVTLFDNFSSGQEWHYAEHAADPRLEVVRGDAKDLAAVESAIAGHDLVIHLASNPDIAAAMTDPTIDFDEGTLLTHHVVEAMRRTGVPAIAYASGSGVYGDLGELEADEEHGPMVPVSTYGSSKLAGEVLISAYAHMFDLRGVVTRFGNVVGRRQTHGVGFDFIRRLRDDPTRLEVMGDGSQSKSYVLATDVVSAVLTAVDAADQPFTAYNVATGDYITVREIVGLALEALGLDPGQVDVAYGPQPRGWKGDVPVVRLSTEKIRALGWEPSGGSADALRESIAAMLADLESGVGA